MAKNARHHIWLETAINFLYFLCVSPFRFKYISKTGKYSLITNPCTKVFPFVIHTICILFTLFGAYISTSALSIKNPRCIFHSVVSYSRFIIYYCLIFTFWTRRNHFINFFTSSSHASTFANFSFSTFTNSQAKWLTLFLCFLMIPAAFVIEVLSYTGGPGFYMYIMSTFSKSAGPQHFEKLLGFEGQQTKMIASGTSDVSVAVSSSQVSSNFTSPQFSHPSHPPMSIFNFAFTIVFDIVRMYVRVCNHVAVLFCILAGATLLQAANCFINSVEKEKDQDKTIVKYIEFCKFVGCLNKMSGCIVLGVILCSPPFFVVYFVGTFTNFEYTGPRVMFYSVLYCCLYIIGAEGSSKITEFKEWIIDYGDGENESQLFAIYVDISQNPLGLRGMGCFTLTYGFLSKMFATIVTFTIILLQFETTPVNAIINIPCE